VNLQRAIEIAVEAHRGQLDKAGNLYVLHPLRVMMSLDTEDEKIVGVLHDVVEDCAPEGYQWERDDFSNFSKLAQAADAKKFTWEYLIKEGISEELFEALQSVSKTPNEEAAYRGLKGDRKKAEQHYLAFIERAKANSIGRNVKAADIKDNLDISRMDVITENDIKRLNRYKAALNLLGT